MEEQSSFSKEDAMNDQIDQNNVPNQPSGSENNGDSASPQPQQVRHDRQAYREMLARQAEQQRAAQSQGQPLMQEGVSTQPHPQPTVQQRAEQPVVQAVPQPQCAPQEQSIPQPTAQFYPQYQAPQQQSYVPYEAPRQQYQQPQWSKQDYEQQYCYNREQSVPPTPGTPVPPEPPVSSDVTAVPKEKKGFSGSTFVAAICVSALLSAGITFGGMALTGNKGVVLGPQNPQSVQGIELYDSETETTLATAVAEVARPSVVCIYNYTQPKSGFSALDGWLTPSANGSDGVDTSSPVLSSLGSGVIISSDGYILTNNHVVEGASKLQVSVDGDSYEGTIVGTDPQSDLAVVKIDGKDLPAIAVANSDNLKVGDWTMAIGSPYGYEETCTTGIVSALSRSTAMSNQSGTTTYYPNLIQTDAAINTGNSGGALVDANGMLIGINTLISSTSGDSSGIGFAIPSNYATAVAQKIIENGEVSHAALGVTVSNEEGVNGGVVAEVVEGSSAAEAGLQPGDVIVKIGGRDVDSASEVVYAMKEHFEGDVVDVVYTRDGQEATATVTLKKSDEAVSKPQQAQPGTGTNGGSGNGNGMSREELEELFDQLFR